MENYIINENPLIPYGSRCFKIMEIINLKTMESEIEICPYLDRGPDGIIKCNFLGIELDSEDNEYEISNMSKECNVNLFDNIIEIEDYEENI